MTIEKKKANHIKLIELERKVNDLNHLMRSLINDLNKVIASQEKTNKLVLQMHNLINNSPIEHKIAQARTAVDLVTKFLNEVNDEVNAMQEHDPIIPPVTTQDDQTTKDV